MSTSSASPAPMPFDLAELTRPDDVRGQHGGSFSHDESVDALQQGHYSTFVVADNGRGPARLEGLHPNVTALVFKFTRGSDGHLLSQLAGLPDADLAGKHVAFEMQEGRSSVYMPAIREFMRAAGNKLGSVFLLNSKSPRHTAAILDAIPVGGPLERIGVLDSEVDDHVLEHLAPHLPHLKNLDFTDSAVSGDMAPHAKGGVRGLEVEFSMDRMDASALAALKFLFLKGILVDKSGSE